MGRKKSRKVAQTVLLYLEGSVLVAFRKKGEAVYNLTLPEEHLVYDLLSEHQYFEKFETIQLRSWRWNTARKPRTSNYGIKMLVTHALVEEYGERFVPVGDAHVLGWQQFLKSH